MNLMNFLKLVDFECEEKSKDVLGRFIHEWARELPSEKREEYLLALRGVGISRIPVKDEVRKSFQDKFERIKIELERIEDGELQLTCEINEEYDDWYHPEEDEYLYHDLDGIGKYIENAYDILQQCFENGLFDITYEIAEVLMNLEIMVCEDEFGVEETFRIPDMLEHNLVKMEYDTVLLLAAHSAYQIFSMEERMGVMYGLMTSCSEYAITLEDVMQAGEELKEFDDFLRNWIIYLGDIVTRPAQYLLEEALELINDESILLENARRLADKHPGLYEKYLRNLMPLALKTKEEGIALYQIGQEALDAIDVKYVIRSRIAALMLQIAEIHNECTKADACYFEIFRSDSTVEHYLTMRQYCHDYEIYEDKVAKICRRYYPKGKINDSVWGWHGSEGEQKENKVNIMTGYMFAFFQKDFDFVLNQGMNVRQALGWSGTFMKCGLAVFLLLLYDSDTLQQGGKQMRRVVYDACQSSSFKRDLSGNPVIYGVEEFWQMFTTWKRTVALSQKQKESFIKHIEKFVQIRLDGIMNANKRNYYGECASYIAALGEVKTSLNMVRDKQRVMEAYRLQYPRRSAFRQELEAFGMIGKR